MSTVYLGTSDFAATVLRTLAGSPHRPSLVVTPPDSRQGRGRKLSPPPAAAAASELGIELLQAEDVNAEPVRERIAAARPRALVVCAFGQLIREPLLSAHPLLNVHPSLLPRWRGAAPIERAIMAGDARTGVCVMRLVPASTPARWRSAPRSRLAPTKTSKRSPRPWRRSAASCWSAPSTSRPRAGSSSPSRTTRRLPTPRRSTPAERRLDPSRPATELAAVVRALTPHVGAYLETAGGERLGVRRARAVDVSVATGTLRSEWGALLLGCCRGALRLEVVQPPGGKPMPVDAYLRGHPLPKL